MALTDAASNLSIDESNFHFADDVSEVWIDFLAIRWEYYQNETESHIIKLQTTNWMLTPTVGAEIRGDVWNYFADALQTN